MSPADQPPPASPLPEHTHPEPRVRHAQLSDLGNIFNLVESMTGDGTLLRRTRREIEAQIDTFVIAETAAGEFLGCAALHRYGPHLAEIRSIAVKPEARGCGAGGLLLQQLLHDVQTTGTGCACLFTRIPSFFAHYGFHAVSLSSIPDKFAKDCVRCPRREHCDEVAMALGELPPYAPAVLQAAQSAQQLVQL